MSYAPKGVNMKFARNVFILISLAIGVLGACPAQAHGSRVHLGVVIGGPGYWYYPPPYYYYPPPYYYYPPVVIVPSSPPVYIERRDTRDSAKSYWYYCPDSKAYYPYVKECASPWQKVEPRPPNS